MPEIASGNASDLVSESKIEPRAKPRKPGSIQTLTSLRFFAAAWVVLLHTFYIKAPLIVQIKEAGFLGVPIFFALSGFVLVYSYESKIDSISNRSFLQARFARVYPLMAVAVVYIAGLEFLLSKMSAGEILITAGAQLTLVFAWVYLAGFGSPLWSVSAEAFFYLMFKKSLPYIKRAAEKTEIATFYVLLLASLVPLAFLPITHTTFGPAGAYLVKTNPLLRFPTFLMGMLVGVSFLHSGKLAKMLTQSSAKIAAVLVAILVIFVLIPWKKSGSIVDILQSVDSGIAMFPACVLILYLAEAKGAVQKFFSSKTLVLLGEASYCIYLIHYPTWIWFRELLPKLHLNSNYLWPFYFAMVVGASILSFKYLETPMRIALRPKELPSVPPTLQAESALLKD